MVKGIGGAVVMGAVAAMLATTVVAEAVEVRVRCDYRNGFRERTKVSVDLKDLAGGEYQATVDGIPSPVVTVTPPNDEFEADFDSNRANIARGATAIPGATGRDHVVHVTAQGPDVSFAKDVPCPGQVTESTP